MVLVVKTGDYECTGYESVFANVSGEYIYDQSNLILCP